MRQNAPNPFILLLTTGRWLLSTSRKTLRQKVFDIRLTRMVQTVLSSHLLHALVHLYQNLAVRCGTSHGNCLEWGIAQAISAEQAPRRLAVNVSILSV